MRGDMNALTSKIAQLIFRRRATIWSKAGCDSTFNGSRVGGSIAIEKAELG
jgi:hypothetical protein